MKKWNIFLIFMILMLFVSSISFAEDNDNLLVKMNGGDVEVRKVPVILDGQALVSDVPSFILIDRTMVPIRMVAENYGADVGWNQKTKTATVTYEDKEIDLTIDSPKASINGESKVLDKNSIPRLVGFSEEYANTMVPLAFISEVLGYEVGYDEEAKVPYINSQIEDTEEEPNNQEDEEVEMPEEEPEEVEAKVKIKKIKVEKIDGKKAIVVYAKDIDEYNTMNLNNPERYVIDFLDASLENGTYFEEDANAGFVKRFRVSQFVPDNNYDKKDKIVRLVLDMKAGTVNPKFKITTEKDKLIICPEENAWKNIEYFTEGVDRFLEIQNKEKTKYETKYFEKSNILQIEVPSNAEDLKEGKIVVKDGLIDNIDIKKNTSSTVIFISFERDVEHMILSRENDDKILLKFKRDSNIPTNERTIIIDPGHGGIKPGAISKNGIKEKDINLEVSLKARDILESLGYNVLMTRDDDSHIGIWERVNFANSTDADLFISFHANAHGNTSIKGVQVLYCPAYKGNKNDVDQYPFAKSIMDFYLKGTGAADKGIIQRADLPVVRETKMPAVLVEVGFMTNEEEELLITDDKYQDKIVDSVAKGIENYFEIY